MKTAKPWKTTIVWMPKLAALAVALLAAGASAHPQAPVLSTGEGRQTAQTRFSVKHHAADPAQVLSRRDEALYRSVFAAQKRGDWNTADNALGEIKDKRLLGHVLADRYKRGAMTLAQGQSWMATYAALPEAPAIYAKAQTLRGFTAKSMKRAAMAAPLPASAGNEASSGFHPFKEAPSEGLANARMAAALFRIGDMARARPLAHKAALSGVPLGLWIEGLSAWKQHDFVVAERSFGSLAQAPNLSSWDHSAAAFWAYRAAMRLDDTTQSHHWLAEAAHNPRSFYGYMAASIENKAAARLWKMPELTAQNVSLLKRDDAGWQALALVQIGQNGLAEGELRRVGLRHNDMRDAALALAEKAHLASVSLQLGAGAGHERGHMYEAAFYPIPSWQPAEGFQVDRALIYALAKHESQFDPSAVSPSGACGLMQIMPATARLMGEQEAGGHKKNPCSDRLFDPEANMALGQKYVRLLSDEPMIGDNLLLLLAAYNGGPGNVARWLDNADHEDPLFFVESLPVRETRDYVQQVLLHYWMYRSRLSQPEKTAAQLSRGEWPRYNYAGVTKQAQADTIVVANATQSK